MKKTVSVVLIGIGGYGNIYVEQFLNANNATIAGVVDIHPEKCNYYEQIMQNKIPIFSSIEDFYNNHHAHLAIIATPIHYHAYQTCYALTHGSNVLCEKPMCPTIQDARKIIKTQKDTGKFVAIGFNWSFSPSVQQLKQDIINGLFGKPLRLKTIALWPRNRNYFTRAPWAGRQYGQDGTPIFDSVANNATSHFLHHMFYLLGSKKNESAVIHSLASELYRANAIENFDTCAVRAVTTENVEVLYYASHAVKDLMEPTFVFEFEKATISYTKGQNVIAKFKNGTEKTYSDPEKNHIQKLWTCIEAIETGEHDIPCGPEAAYTHVSCINGMHRSVPKITPFPQSMVKLDQKTGVTWIEGLYETLIDAFDNWSLPNETRAFWAKKGETVT